MKETEPTIKTDSEAQAMYRIMLSMVAEQQPTNTTRLVIDAILPPNIRISSDTTKEVRKTLDYIQNSFDNGITDSRRKEIAIHEPVLKLADAWNCVLLAETRYSHIADKERKEILENSIKRVEKLRKNATDLIQTTDFSGVPDKILIESVNRFTIKERK
jgi:hypothetical protein